MFWASLADFDCQWGWKVEGVQRNSLCFADEGPLPETLFNCLM